MTATQEVAQAIGAIQSGARENITAVDQSDKAVGHATEMVNASGRALQEISDLVTATADRIRAIATAAEEQSATSDAINRAVDEVNAVAQETADGMMRAATTCSAGGPGRIPARSVPGSAHLGLRAASRTKAPAPTARGPFVGAQGCPAAGPSASRRAALRMAPGRVSGARWSPSVPPRPGSRSGRWPGSPGRRCTAPPRRRWPRRRGSRSGTRGARPVPGPGSGRRGG